MLLRVRITLPDKPGSLAQITKVLGAAGTDCLFRAPENVLAEFPQYRALTEYDELLAAITELL